MIADVGMCAGQDSKYESQRQNIIRSNTGICYSAADTPNNASISELPSIASSSSLVGTVTGSFLKLKVITSLSLDNNDLFSPNTSFQV